MLPRRAALRLLTFLPPLFLPWLTVLLFNCGFVVVLLLIPNSLLPPLPYSLLPSLGVVKLGEL